MDCVICQLIDATLETRYLQEENLPSENIKNDNTVSPSPIDLCLVLHKCETLLKKVKSTFCSDKSHT